MDFTQIQEKHCFQCNTTKPSTEFYRCAGRADGRQTQCKACQSSASKTYRAAHPEADSARAAAYYAANKTAIDEKSKSYPSRSPTAVRARGEKYYQDNRTKVLAQSALRYQRNREEILAQCAARFKDNKAAWYEKTRRYLARKLQAMPGWANKDAITILYTKAKELSAPWGIELNVDHVVPLKSPLVCGLHTHANLQLLEKLDNIRKGNRYWPDMPGES